MCRDDGFQLLGSAATWLARNATHVTSQLFQAPVPQSKPCQCAPTKQQPEQAKQQESSRSALLKPRCFQKQ